MMCIERKRNSVNTSNGRDCPSPSLVVSLSAAIVRVAILFDLSALEVARAAHQTSRNDNRSSKGSRLEQNRIPLQSLV
eukprot:4937011-Amphidinium_carterae.1